jgi:glycosyltransferase involved in cell wall biosynthesis
MAKERPEMIDEMAGRGYTVKWLRYDDRHRKSGMLRALPWLLSHMRGMKPDIVHCNLFDDSVPGLIAAKLAGIRTRVITRQDTGYHWMHTPKWMAFDRMNARAATDIIAISREAKEFLVDKEDTPAEKIRLVHNGIPPEVFTRQRPETIALLAKRFGTEGRFPVVGTIARFIPWKGYDQITDAASIIVKKYPKALFMFCGRGDQQEAIRHRVGQLGLEDNVVFTDWVEREDIPSLYALMDVYLHAAVLEPFGLVYAEAMMNGVPIVSTSTGAARDAIQDGINGILADRSGQALAHGVEKLLSMDLEAIGNAGRRTALEMYSFDVMWNGTLDVYKQALSRNHQ